MTDYKRVYKAAFSGSLPRLIPAVLCLINPWVGVYWLSKDAMVKPPLQIFLPLFISSGAIALVFGFLGLLILTKRVQIDIIGEHLVVMESTFIGKRETRVCRADTSEIIFDRSCIGGVYWSITLTQPKRFLFGKGLSREDLYEINDVLQRALA